MQFVSLGVSRGQSIICDARVSEGQDTHSNHYRDFCVNPTVCP